MSAPTIFERLGGQVSIDVVVERFYDRVLADPELGPFFDSVAQVDLEAHQRSFLAAALGGPDDYSGRPISVAHARLGITNAQFDRIVDHLVDALSVSAISAELTDEVGAAVSALRAQVVGA